MPVLYQSDIRNYGLKCVHAYNDPISGEKFIIVGNKNELEFYRVASGGQLIRISSLNLSQVMKILFRDAIAFFRTAHMIGAIDLTHINDAQGPNLIASYSDFDETSVRDITLFDTLLAAITGRTLKIFEFNPTDGFIELGALAFPPSLHNLSNITSFDRYWLYVLKRSLGVFYIINVSDPQNPIINAEIRLPHQTYRQIHTIGQSVWFTGDFGTTIYEYPERVWHDLDTNFISYGLQLFTSNDTLYVADGHAGLRVYTFSGNPWENLRLIGQYRTRNFVSSVACVDDNFYVTDYYSLQHLRWGEPLNIEEEYFLPQTMTLNQNYPNPFNSATTISFSLPTTGHTKVEIYDVMGRLTQTLFDGNHSAGVHNFVWQPSGIASGLYFCRLSNGQETLWQKMLLIK